MSEVRGVVADDEEDVALAASSVPHELGEVDAGDGVGGDRPRRATRVQRPQSTSPVVGWVCARRSAPLAAGSPSSPVDLAAPRRRRTSPSGRCPSGSRRRRVILNWAVSPEVVADVVVKPDVVGRRTPGMSQTLSGVPGLAFSAGIGLSCGPSGRRGRSPGGAEVDRRCRRTAGRAASGRSRVPPGPHACRASMAGDGDLGAAVAAAERDRGVGLAAAARQAVDGVARGLGVEAARADAHAGRSTRCTRIALAAEWLGEELVGVRGVGGRRERDRARRPARTIGVGSAARDARRRARPADVPSRRRAAGCGRGSRPTSRRCPRRPRRATAGYAPGHRRRARSRRRTLPGRRRRSCSGGRRSRRRRRCAGPAGSAAARRTPA